MGLGALGAWRGNQTERTRRPLPRGCDGFTDAFNGNQRLPHDERSIEMQNAIAQASKMSVAALVSRDAPTMPKAVYFHDQTK